MRTRPSVALVALAITAGLSLTSLLAWSPAPVLAASYQYTCSGGEQLSQANLPLNLVTGPANEVIGEFTSAPQYPCYPTNGTPPSQGNTFDDPFVNGADLQEYATGSPVFQIGMSFCINGGSLNCSSSLGAPANEPFMVWTGTSENYQPVTFWNQGLGAAVMKINDVYEVAVMADIWDGATYRWKFGARDLTANTGWTYWWGGEYTWGIPGGYAPWWGFETNNQESGMGDGYYDPYLIGIHTMEYKLTSGTWTQPRWGYCEWNGAHYSYYGCTVYSNGYYVNAYTLEH